MSYKIVITETRQVKKIIGAEWRKIGDREETRDPHLLRDSEDHITRIADVMGYTPEMEGTRDETRTVLEQNVDTLDMAAVIKAINKL